MLFATKNTDFTSFRPPSWIFWTQKNLYISTFESAVLINNSTGHRPKSGSCRWFYNDFCKKKYRFHEFLAAILDFMNTKKFSHLGFRKYSSCTSISPFIDQNRAHVGGSIMIFAEKIQISRVFGRHLWFYEHQKIFPSRLPKVQFMHFNLTVHRQKSGSCN